MMVIRQNSAFRFWWDVGMVGLIFVSSILVPYQFAFDHKSSISTSLVIYLIDLFFLFDIFFNFHTSFRKEGTEILEKRTIQKRYLRTLFPVDLVANLPLDAFFLLAGSQVEYFNISLILVLRLPRLLRLVRLLVIIRRWEWLEWTHPIYLRIFRFLSLITFAVHWISCTWFFIGFVDDFPENSWMVAAGVVEAPAIDQYIRSLYWTITTMTTVGYGDITPQRSVEYLGAMIVMVIGASTYAYIIGSLASLFSNIDAAKAQYWNRVDALTQFLYQQQVPRELNAKVRDYYHYLWTRRRGLQEAMFSDLPTSMRLEILLYLTKDILEKVPLFSYCSPTLREELLSALSVQVYPPDSWIVKAGSKGSQVFFISQGEVEVTSAQGDTVFTVLKDGEYFGLLPLMLKEKRTASVRTLTYCEILILEGRAFESIKENYPEFGAILKKISSLRSEKMAALILEGVIL